MERLKGFVSDNVLYLGTGVAVVASSAYLYRRWYRKAPLRVCGVDYPADTVIVHGAGQTKMIPSLGHFVMKLETYLRIAKIPSQLLIDQNAGGPKNKVPWIEYNGHVMGDSQLIMNYLNRQLNVDLNKHLSPCQRALAWSVQKWIEEFTYWLNAYTRWYTYSAEMFREHMEAPAWMAKLSDGKMKNIGHIVGVGRHTKEEIAEFVMNDLRHLSTILGDQKYMFGDQPAEVDCAVFGILAEIRWATPDACPGKQLLINELTSLTAYMDRIKELYWPDWDDRLKK